MEKENTNLDGDERNERKNNYQQQGTNHQEDETKGPPTTIQ